MCSFRVSIEEVKARDLRLPSLASSLLWWLFPLEHLWTVWEDSCLLLA